MSFNKFSASKTAPSNDKPDDKTQDAPTVTESAAEPADKNEKEAPAQKS